VAVKLLGLLQRHINRLWLVLEIVFWRAEDKLTLRCGGLTGLSFYLCIFDAGRRVEEHGKLVQLGPHALVVLTGRFEAGLCWHRVVLLAFRSVALTLVLVVVA